MDNFILGDELKAEYSVSKEVYKGFLDIFKDNNPMHTNVNYAKEHGFSEIVMHGNILNGFISHFMGMHLPIKNLVIVSQKIKFRNPVFMYDLIEIKSTVNDIHVALGLICFKLVLTNQEGQKVANGTVEIKVL